ncbi:SAV0927 family protein [Brevibacillus sp. SYSU BS000544]|uniref:SAV0927 family protein n=1 Tax=Brevibacillus sp. SYSU BS000544 TaxID=3416443 RepID=UPI003CE4BDCF
MGFDYLYDISEQPITRFFSFATDHSRYDFCILFTNQFQGKSMVICMQTLKATLLSANDVDLSFKWPQQLGIASEDLDVLKRFFKNALYSTDSLRPQY